MIESPSLTSPTPITGPSLPVKLEADVLENPLDEVEEPVAEEPAAPVVFEVPEPRPPEESPLDPIDDPNEDPCEPPNPPLFPNDDPPAAVPAAPGEPNDDAFPAADPSPDD